MIKGTQGKITEETEERDMMKRTGTTHSRRSKNVKDQEAGGDGREQDMRAMMKEKGPQKKIIEGKEERDMMTGDRERIMKETGRTGTVQEKKGDTGDTEERRMTRGKDILKMISVKDQAKKGAIDLTEVVKEIMTMKEKEKKNWREEKDVQERMSMMTHTQKDGEEGGVKIDTRDTERMSMKLETKEERIWNGQTRGTLHFNQVVQVLAH